MNKNDLGRFVEGELVQLHYAGHHLVRNQFADQQCSNYGICELKASRPTPGFHHFDRINYTRDAGPFSFVRFDSAEIKTIKYVVVYDEHNNLLCLSVDRWGEGWSEKIVRIRKA